MAILASVEKEQGAVGQLTLQSTELTKEIECLTI